MKYLICITKYLIILAIIFLNNLIAQSNIILKNHTISSGGLIEFDSTSNIKYNLLTGQTAIGPLVGAIYQGGTGFIPTDIEDDFLNDNAQIIKSFKLYQNYPNPFNPITTIKYQVPKTSQVSILVYNVLGQKVKELVNQKKTTGVYEVYWNGNNKFGKQVGSGMYFFYMHAGDYVNVKKMLLLR